MSCRSFLYIEWIHNPFNGRNQLIIYVIILVVIVSFTVFIWNSPLADGTFSFNDNVLYDGSTGHFNTMVFNYLCCDNMYPTCLYWFNGLVIWVCIISSFLSTLPFLILFNTCLTSLMALSESPSFKIAIKTDSWVFLTIGAQSLLTSSSPLAIISPSSITAYLFYLQRTLFCKIPRIPTPCSPAMLNWDRLGILSLCFDFGFKFKLFFCFFNHFDT